MSKTYIFTGSFAVGAENEDSARDGLLELLSYLVGREDTDPFVLEEVEEGADEVLVVEEVRTGNLFKDAYKRLR